MRYNGCMEFGKSNETHKFKSPEEEIDFLRQEVAWKERELEKVYTNRNTEELRHHAAKEVVREYDESKTENILQRGYEISPEEKDSIVLKLSPEKHDSKMEELLGVLQEKGLKNALDVVQKLNNPHITDDFHRFLIQYIQSVPESVDFKKSNKLFKALHMKLYEVLLPDISEDDKARTLSEMISSMEQFYAGLSSLSDGKDNLPDRNYFTIEIALSNLSQDVVFYVSVPRTKSDLFEKHMNAIFPKASLVESYDDYNIFNDNGVSVGAVAQPLNNPILPIKTYDKFDNDPINIILGIFSKLKKYGEGAAIQIVVSPAGDYFIKKYGKALESIRKGASIESVANISNTFGKELAKAFEGLVFGTGIKKKNNSITGELSHIDDVSIQEITNKISSTIVNTNIRIVASSDTQISAKNILIDLQSVFNQFTNTTGNGFKFEEKKGKKILKLFQEFSYRIFNYDESFPLNLKELSTILHFPITKTNFNQLKQVRAGVAPAPLSMRQEGTLLGSNIYRGMKSDVYFGKEDRLRHFYVIGQTGTGKTTLLKNMIIQDIEDGNGVCMIDPHGTDIQDVLANIPPEREKDVIYFDPSNAERPMGLNMLEYNMNYPEQKTFVVNELFSIFQKLYGANPESMGPMFEQYFRNATMLVIEDPESGNTLLDVSRVLSDAKFREMKLSRCKNPIVVQFWREIASKAGGEASLANIVPYITSKFDVFLANEIMRPIIAQEKSSFDFREIMDGRKILLVNLSKGKLGDINSNLLGLILVGKILMAALSRVDTVGGGERLPDFYLYIDEFQNVTTPSISTILSEARKYGLSLNIAHQYIAQLDDGIKNSVFGNVGSMAVFRVGSEDAEFLQKQFEPMFTSEDIMSLENYNAYIKLLINGQPEKPFNIKIFAPRKGDIFRVQKIIEVSQIKYGRDKKEIEEEITRKYQIIKKA